MSSSDSNYAAATRHLRASRLIAASVDIRKSTSSSKDTIPDFSELLFGAAACRLGDDDIPVERHEAAVAPLLEEGELDADAIVVSPTGNSSVAANNAAERRRREEGWTDLGLEQFTTTRHSRRPAASSNNSSSNNS